jgi:hypothetical protein
MSTSMDSLTYKWWRAEFDREATLRAHAAMPTGGAESCICQTCKNYVAQKPVPFPSDFLEVLSKLGIDPNKEIEVYEMEPDYPRGVEYHGWFYFVGHVEADAGAPDPANGPIVTEFSYYLASGPAYAVKQFADFTVSRVEFQCLRLPWAKGFSPDVSPE